MPASIDTSFFAETLPHYTFGSCSEIGRDPAPVDRPFDFESYDTTGSLPDFVFGAHNSPPPDKPSSTSSQCHKTCTDPLLPSNSPCVEASGQALPLYMTPPTSCLVCLLPAELLGKCFWHMLEDESQSIMKTGLSLDVPPIWSVVLNVCSWWREVAEGHMPLWQTIHLSDARWVAFSVGHSAPLPLAVHMRGSFSKSSLRALSQHFHRVQAFHIDWRFLIPHHELRREMPALRQLDLCGDVLHFLNGAGQTTRCMMNLGDVTTSAFFHRPLPNLRILRLDGFNVPLDFRPLVEALVVLDLRNIQLWSSVYEFVSTLRGLPGLVELRLTSCLTLQTLGTNDSLVPIRLPNLRILHLSDLASGVLLATKLMIYPDSASVTLDCASVLPDDAQQLACLLTRNPTSPYVLSLAGSHTSSCQLRYALFGNELCVTHDSLSDALPFLTAFLSALPTQTVREVEVDRLYLLRRSEPWASYFPFSAVESVTLSGMSGVGLLGALAVPVSLADDALFPRLRKVCLRQIVRNPLHVEIPEDTYKAVSRAMQSRREMGQVLWLDIRASDISRDQVESVQMSFGRDAVVWDGCEVAS
ncbi:hypothetical protein K488DRAFT_74916 [Vararia minispora EC-137]|uniref:Uncharacterized protein n=1 Tax=Vararia minispora EC-137 TaxID=1314806 RepID=A0ACB8Q5G3_9AGAM|nr:hypothetical protein K488DRAFT_74916 [Vararia minispora EC-137]